MATFDRDLVRVINTGHCFVLFGAGPSCEIGLPSWHKLAETSLTLLTTENHSTDIDLCHQLLSEKRYPEIFSVIEKRIGLVPLLDHIEHSVPSSSRYGIIYSYLACWPFAVYLTTNFDDYLLKYFQKKNQTFLVRYNSIDDFRTLRADTRGIIYKIHGDYSTPNDIVLTNEQYEIFRKSPEKQYWREKISSVLHMVPVVIIGYSVYDPDFKDQLERAKDIASPDHPIFMFAAGMPQNEITKYYQEFNIRIISYSNPDGTHSELHRILRRYHPFIAKRSTPHLGQIQIDHDKADIASSINIFTRLNLSTGNASCLKKSFEALIVAILGDSDQSGCYGLSTLQNQLALRLHIPHVDPQALKDALSSLHEYGFIEIMPSNQQYSLTPSGKEKLEETKAQRKLRHEQFEEACRMFLSKEYPDLDSNVIIQIIQELDNGLVRAFEKRGAEMAQATFSENRIDLSTATDILDVLNNQSANISDIDAHAAFADLMLEIILQPTKEMKEQLADLSQGYFSYHALGLDTRCSNERLQIAQKKIWILDSSVILPLIAKDCINHEFAVDVLKKMKEIKLKLATTDRLFDEVIEHAKWAIRNFKDASNDSPFLLQVASGGPGYKQNLFIDGYMMWSLQQGTPSIEEYFRTCFGESYESNISGCIQERIKEFGIEVTEFSKWPEFQQVLWGDRHEIEKRIIEQRHKRGTYRSDEQCIAEAEVFILCRGQEAIFLSQSGILNSIDPIKHGITWTPESMYRFLSSFSRVPPSEDLLYQSMVQDFFYCGFDIINRDVLNEYFTVPIRQSRMNLDEEKNRYQKALGDLEYKRYRDGYDSVPDLQKPFYSMQFAFYVARKDAKRVAEYEERVKSVESKKALTEKERNEYERLKAIKAEKKRKAKKKERRAQSKKTSKKRKRR